LKEAHFLNAVDLGEFAFAMQQGCEPGQLAALPHDEPPEDLLIAVLLLLVHNEKLLEEGVAHRN